MTADSSGDTTQNVAAQGMVVGVPILGVIPREDLGRTAVVEEVEPELELVGGGLDFRSFLMTVVVAVSLSVVLITVTSDDQAGGTLRPTPGPKDGNGGEGPVHVPIPQVRPGEDADQRGTLIGWVPGGDLDTPREWLWESWSEEGRNRGRVIYGRAP